MIKPVYFGNKENREIEFVNNLKNFSEWVKEKIREEIGVVNLYQSKIVGLDNKMIEDLVRKIVNEMNINLDSGENISTGKEENKIDELEENVINIDKWSL